MFCGGLFDHDPKRLKVGSKTFDTCSDECLDKLTEQRDAQLAALADARLKARAEEERVGADEQHGWKRLRWVNQHVKRRKKEFDAWREEQEFENLQKKLEREAKRR
jgi:hypothetical protein